VNLGAVDTEKIAVFLLFFVAFVWITRRLFSREKPPGPGDFPVLAPPEPPEDYEIARRSGQPAMIGAELPFPVGLPPVERLPNGRYNRPKVLNYYFSNLDLKAGPENPRVFCDQMFVQFEAPETGAAWTNEYTVATPFGLQELLDTTGQNQILNGTVIIVPRWDIALILRTVLDDVIHKYAHAEPDSDEAEDSTKRYQG
jgi:hypothetical protein